jgi:chemotaxis protein MotB
MFIDLGAAARAIPLTALMLGACVSQSAYEKQGQELQGARAQAAAEQSQLAKMQQENKWVVAGDVLFAEGGYQLSASGKQALSQYVPQVRGVQNAKVVVYGYTDNLPVGPPLQRAGITNNIDLSSRRADNVVAYLTSKGVSPNIISAKGFGDTHPIALNDTPDGRAKNRRIEIVLEGPRRLTHQTPRQCQREFFVVPAIPGSAREGRPSGEGIQSSEAPAVALDPAFAGVTPSRSNTMGVSQ